LNVQLKLRYKTLFIVYQRGKLIPDKLEEMIKCSLKNNELPFLVALTGGTTVLGIRFCEINE
jgi:hypothetical protein